jgi:beta-galactosidase
MQFSGLSAQGLLAEWKARGANETQMITGPCYGYELQGFYGFSSQPKDTAVEKQLKDKVKFLAQDAPSLAGAINVNAPVVITNLTQDYHNAENGIAQYFTPLVSCGKNLTKTPVAEIGFRKSKGKLIVSQLLTEGRLAKGFGTPGFYGIRYDEVAVQYVLNMISLAIAH